uniref:Uncharacterized protein n=1 Tax=Rhizophora mucronata TaxID=61149 RepID=A0A2P2NJ21_RHIMU
MVNGGLRVQRITTQPLDPKVFITLYTVSLLLPKHGFMLSYLQ